jgi:hypothetical protein
MAILGCLLLLALTHVGVLGTAVVLVLAVFLVLVVTPNFAGWRLALPWLIAGVVVLVLAAALMLWRFDPVRIHRLMTALTNPMAFSEDGRQIPTPPGGGIDAMGWLPYVGFAATVVRGMVVAWRRRNRLPAADVALVGGAAITVLLLTGPWFSTDKAMRFYLIALVPSLVVAAFGLLQVTRVPLRRFLLGSALSFGIGRGLPTLWNGGSGILSDAAMIDLQDLSRHISNPDRSLVCAPHGVEWWAAWFLRTRIAQASALEPDDWQRYESVCFLEIKSGLQMPFAPGAPAPRGDPPGSGPPGPGRPTAMPPPPAAGINPREPAPTPPGAELLQDDAYLSFARIATPPDLRSVPRTR